MDIVGVFFKNNQLIKLLFILERLAKYFERGSI